MTSLGWLLGLFVRLWLSTLRVEIVGPLGVPGDRPWVYAFWHGTQLSLLARPRRRKTAVLVSLSRDGALQTGAMRSHGMRVVRGSSSRGGARGLRGLIDAMRAGSDAAFAVDGPRGPERRSKPGVLAAARAAKAVVVPVGVAAARAMVLRRAWDRFLIPLPFSRVVVVLGPALEPEGASGEIVDAAIDRAERTAEERLGARVTSVSGPPILRARAHR